MNLLKTSILTLTLTAFPAMAVADVVNNTTAGSLSNKISDPSSITTLTVSGSINAADIDFITFNMPGLKTLDLSMATIAEYNGDAILGGGHHFAANEIPDYAFFGSPASTITLPNSVTSIGEAAFASSGITAITIPANVTEIDRLAFDNCQSLTSVKVPYTVTTLGESIFRDCSSLTDATINSRVEKIGDAMFQGCTELSTVSLATTVTEIGNDAFKSCRSLSSFQFPSKITSIGNYAFYNSGLAKVDLSVCGALSTIGNFAFAQCQDLEDVTIANVVTLGEGAFLDDTSLTRFELPASLTAIPSFTFKGTTSVDPTSISDNVTSIGSYALTGWDHVSEFTLPTNLAYIGDNAMENWSSLTKIKATENMSVPDLGDNVWAEIDPSEVTLLVNKDTEPDFSTADQWKDFNIEVETSGTPTLIPDQTESDNPRVNFSMSNRTLIIESTDSDIAEMIIFDVTGRQRYASTVTSPKIIVDTKPWSTGVIIVTVRLVDNSTASVKLSL